MLAIYTHHMTERYICNEKKHIYVNQIVETNKTLYMNICVERTHHVPLKYTYISNFEPHTIMQ